MRVQKSLAGILAILLVGFASAQDPAAAGKSKWPTAPIQKPETPPPALAIYTVKADEWFLIERDTPAIVLGSPNGLLEIIYTNNAEGCKIKYKGKFAGGGGVSETKVLTSKFIIELKPVKTGRCEVIIIPHGVQAEAAIERKTVDVDAGEGAQPPPGGGEPPIVVPPPVTTPTKVHFMLVRKDGPSSQDFTNSISLPAWKTLTASGHAYKDYTLTEANAVWQAPAGTSLPYLVGLDSKNRAKVVVPVGPLPGNDAAVLKLIEGVK